MMRPAPPHGMRRPGAGALCAAIFALTLGAGAQSPQNPSPLTDSTRPHPRVARRELPGLRLPLGTGGLFIPYGIRRE